MNALILAAALALQPTPNFAAQQLAVSVPPPPEAVMAIPEELRTRFRNEVLNSTTLPEARLRRLVAFVFDEKYLGVKYKPDATNSVAESFKSRNVNCLSSTLLVVALAREAGFDAYGQQIDRVLSWSSNDGVVMQSMHANAIVEVDRKRYVVDVDARGTLASSALRPVSDEVLLASFYGNRAMELMVSGKPDEAKTWLDTAMRHSSDDSRLWNNAGVLSLRLGQPDEAERYYLKAVQKDPNQTSVLSNLIALYQNRGDSAKESLWRHKAEKALSKDPYHQFTLGRRYEESEDYLKAAQYYRLAVKLNEGEHQFHFGLARVYLQLGELDKADRELALAQRFTYGDLRERYEGKLLALRKMRR